MSLKYFTMLEKPLLSTGSGIWNYTGNFVLEPMHRVLLSQHCKLPNQKASDTFNQHYMAQTYFWLYSGYTVLVSSSSRPWKLHHCNCHLVPTTTFPTLQTPTWLQQLLMRVIVTVIPNLISWQDQQAAVRKAGTCYPHLIFPPLRSPIKN